MIARDASVSAASRAPARETSCGNEILSIGVEERGDAWWMVVRGDLDLSTAQLLERELLVRQARDDRPITIDLRELKFMDLAGLRVLIAACGRSRTSTSRIDLVRGPRVVQRVIELSGSESLLPLTDPPAAPIA